MPMTLSQSTYHIIYKSNTFYLFNDALHIEKMHVLAKLTIYIIYFEQNQTFLPFKFRTIGSQLF